MIGLHNRMRGQPLVVLGALLLGWAGARVTSMGDGEALEAVLPVGTATAAQVEPARFTGAGPQSFAFADAAQPSGPASSNRPMIQYVPVWYPAVGRAAYPYGTSAAYMPGHDPSYGAEVASARNFSGEFAPGHPIAAARRDDEELPGGLPSLFTGAPRPARYGEAGALLGGRLGRLLGNHSRWSMDAWALIRKDPAKLPDAGTLPATYGASQAGAILRYRLAMQDPRQPSAYLRTTSTLGGLMETSAALGLSARPLPAVPVIAAVEGRLTEQGGSRRVQPAVMAVTALPLLRLPAALRAEVYAQGGYVAGRYATPFADGQVRVDRAILDLGRAQARVGGGAWGGIQKGTSRLDAGPGATVSMPLSPKVFGKLAVDWRFRVAGNAEPDSGPALTMAAGF